VSGFVAACFVWAMVVFGISVAMVERGARQWWLVLVFGLLVLLIVVAAVYGALVSLLRAGRGAERALTEVPTQPAAPATARSASVAGALGPPQSPPGIASPPIEPLTRREVAVLEQLAAGRSNREIAKALYIAPGTVKAHLNHIFRKLGATSRLQAVARAREAGLLDVHEPENKPG
jgi:DNA-binding CsgD family transcriptional regulator